MRFGPWCEAHRVNQLFASSWGESMPLAHHILGGLVRQDVGCVETATHCVIPRGWGVYVVAYWGL